MNGNEAYEDKYKNKIEFIFENNNELKDIKGFYYYIHDMSCSSAHMYLTYITKFLRTVNVETKDLSLDDYTMYLSSISDKTSSYQIAVYSALKKFSTYLKAVHKNNDDPMQYVSRPKFREGHNTVEKRENGFLDEKEIGKYLKNVAKNRVGSELDIMRRQKYTERDFAIVSLLLNTGMRCSALYKLNVENINFEEKTLYTVDKGNKIQEYFLSDQIISILNTWLDKRKDFIKTNENALFVSNRGRRMSTANIFQIVNKYASNIDGKHITPHKLRATYGTELYKKTKDVYFVQQCMGHSSPKTTEKYIRGEKATARAKAADIMGIVTKI